MARKYVLVTQNLNPNINYMCKPIRWSALNKQYSIKLRQYALIKSKNDADSTVYIGLIVVMVTK